MLTYPQHISGISHPLIADIYLKKEFTHGHRENVLVIEAKASNENSTREYSSFNSYLIDLLPDLETLKGEAEAKVGKLHRIDIRGR